MKTILFDILNNATNMLVARQKVNVQTYSELEDLMLDAVNYMHNCRIGMARLRIGGEWQCMDMYDLSHVLD